ncbi:hypothetical protein PRIPAC_97211 [Pristionchus pacificus]|uniref:Piwi domain-containing protein n=1 Tax=Pristionchus pacificus TaxID=54126 RepID=A0A2A6B2R8_PRIPA|nr:hypothetical protein PRIPAC_97211 [Pristionchus pacificus]|eukprot:PDM60162.1 hypothetical protein PRIPAC_53987 [Pristionchus pacificus]
MCRSFRHNYDPFTGGKLYRSDPVGHSKGLNRFAENVKFGQERRPGMFKGMALVDRKGSTLEALNIDATTGTFWREGSLDKAIMEINGHNYDPFTGGKLYRSDPVGHSKGLNRFAENVKFGQERRPGMFKGMALVDRKGSTLEALNIDATTGTFWREGSLDKAIMEINGHNYDPFTGGKLYRSDPVGHSKGLNRFAENVKFGQERRPGMFKGMALVDRKGSTLEALNIDATTGTFWREGSLDKAIMEINGHNYDPFTGGKLYRSDPVGHSKGLNRFAENVKFGQERRPGMFKGMALVDRKGSTLEALNIDATTGTFWREGSLDKAIMEINGLGKWPLIVSMRQRRKMDDPTKFEVDTQYFFFAIELLKIKKNQRVSLKKQGAAPVRAMRVDDRWNRTHNDLEALNLFVDSRENTMNSVLRAFGMNVIRKPLGTKAITRRMAEISTNFDTRYSVFETAAHITTLYIIFSTDPSSFRIDKVEFTINFIAAAKKKGMRIDHVHSDIVPHTELFQYMLAINEKRKKDSNLKNTIFLYIEPDEGKHHDELKLFERRFCIVTQHLKMENATQLAYKKVMMENVLLKLNIKGGGHNYNVKPEIFAYNAPLDGEKKMIMGYDVAHPTGPSRAEKMADTLPDPSVVGFSFNGGVSPDSFIGDYHFQQPTKERVHDDVLNVRMKWMLLTFETRRGVLPPLIIVVRDGISDGQYSQGMDELAALREAAREYAVSKERTDKIRKLPDPHYNPNFIFVVATKRHHKRIYVENGKSHDNMPAMSVVDDTITNPSLLEFFLQSHTPLQGMAKATKYTVLKDDIGTTSDAMQSLMGALCFEHQVSMNAISIPEPVYQSDEWAKRGATNVRKFKEIFLKGSPFEKGFTYEDLGNKLSYWNSSLDKVRVNA